MDTFTIRRAVERLRDGLYDPEVVNQLTVEEDRIKEIFSKGLKALEAGQSDPLCICGAYGQGKSHTLSYLNRLALSQGFACSLIQLDIREVPFHQFPLVYQSLMQKIVLPDGKTLTQAWKKWGEKGSLEFLDTMPHRFKVVLKAMLCRGKPLSPEESTLKKHLKYPPKEHGEWLEKALLGHKIPIGNLKSVFKYRDVDGYREESLNCRGSDPYIQMVHSLGRILKEMGYKGLLLFFDEAESIAQMRLGLRVKSYELLDQFFQGKSFVFPVFAFTDDFFEKMKNESYDHTEVFPKNYAEAWQRLNILRLQNFSSKGWETLTDRFMQLYSHAYRVELPEGLREKLLSLVDKLKTQETRFKLKALVNKLDIETQQKFLNN